MRFIPEDLWFNTGQRREYLNISDGGIRRPTGWALKKVFGRLSTENAEISAISPSSPVSAFQCFFLVFSVRFRYDHSVLILLRFCRLLKGKRSGTFRSTRLLPAEPRGSIKERSLCKITLKNGYRCRFGGNLMPAPSR